MHFNYLAIPDGFLCLQYYVPPYLQINFSSTEIMKDVLHQSWASQTFHFCSNKSCISYTPIKKQNKQTKKRTGLLHKIDMHITIKFQNSAGDVYGERQNGKRLQRLMARYLESKCVIILQANCMQVAGKQKRRH